MTSPDNVPTTLRPMPAAPLHRAAAYASARLGSSCRRLPVRAALPLLAMLASASLPVAAGDAPLFAPFALAISVLLSTVSLPAIDGAERNGWRAVAASLSLLILSPALTAGVCLLAGQCGLDVRDWGWATVAAGAPVSVGAVLTARTLGLGQRRMAGIMVLSNLGAPLVLPQLAWAAGITGSAGAEIVAQQMALTCGLPVLVGIGLRLLPILATAPVRRVAANGGMRTLVALGALRGLGLSSQIACDLSDAPSLAALAVLSAACGTVAAWTAMRRGSEAVLAGLFRSNTLVWASLAGVLTERANLLMAFAMVGSYAAPVLAAMVQRRVRCEFG